MIRTFFLIITLLISIFSATGNTRGAAEKIMNLTGADIGQSDDTPAKQDGTGDWLQGRRFPADAAETDIQAWISETGEADMDGMLHLYIDDTEVSITWEDNASVDALKELVAGGPVSIDMSMYGGFEQVGPIGTSIASNDVQTVTQPGDIVLYASSQIVIFYGSNSWAYTKLGRISDRTAEELAELLGNGDVTITLSM